jgi:hypothetical protein
LSRLPKSTSRSGPSFPFSFQPTAKEIIVGPEGDVVFWFVGVTSAPGHKPLLPTKVYFFFFFKKKCWLEGRFVGELRENGHGRVAKG